MLRNRLVDDFWFGCFLEGDEGGAGGGSGSGAGDDDQGGEEGAGGGKEAELRREAARYRRELRDTQARLSKLESEKLTESEKRDLRAKELEAENATLKAERHAARVEAAAATAGARNPAIVAKLVPADADDPKKAIEQIKKDNPYLFGTAGSADGGAGGNSGGSGRSMNDLIRRGRG